MFLNLVSIRLVLIQLFCTNTFQHPSRPCLLLPHGHKTRGGGLLWAEAGFLHFGRGQLRRLAKRQRRGSILLLPKLAERLLQIEGLAPVLILPVQPSIPLARATLASVHAPNH